MRLSLLLLVIGIIFVTTGYTYQMNPQCKDEVQVRVLPRDVYDEIIASSEIPRDLF